MKNNLKYLLLHHQLYLKEDVYQVQTKLQETIKIRRIHFIVRCYHRISHLAEKKNKLSTKLIIHLQITLKTQQE